MALGTSQTFARFAGARPQWEGACRPRGALAGPRPPIRYCVDWSEQAHHLSGALGAALAARMAGLAEQFGVDSL
jgi:hypothetical protein